MMKFHYGFFGLNKMMVSDKTDNNKDKNGKS